MLDAFLDRPGILWGFLVALGVVLALTPLVGKLALALGVVDEPGEERRIHRRPVPLLGGLALFAGLLVSSLAFLDLGRSEYRGILLGATVATAVGMVDDFRGLPWWGKLAGQLGAAAIPVGFGLTIDRFTLPLVGVHALPGWLAVALTVLWIVAIMNMVNFVDGLDGLAAGICAIAAVAFTVIALSLAKPGAAVLAAIVVGCCLGFLRHNFYPARIFMGDSGALLLGFALATVAVQGLLKTAATVALFFPLLALAVPILDTSFVVAKRLKYRRPITAPDRSHLHHRFVNIGFSQRRTALYLYGWCSVLAGAAIATRFIPVHEGGVWRLWPSVGAALVALVALAASIYVVVLLEIVKLPEAKAQSPARGRRFRRNHSG